MNLILEYLLVPEIPLLQLFPLSRFAEWRDAVLSDLDPSIETVVLCHHGVRSMQMANVRPASLGILRLYGPRLI